MAKGKLGVGCDLTPCSHLVGTASGHRENQVRVSGWVQTDGGSVVTVMLESHERLGSGSLPAWTSFPLLLGKGPRASPTVSWVLTC